MRLLVVCADDYAISEPVSKAIQHLANIKRISATSVMSLSPLWPEHSQELIAFKGLIDVGLHLDWTSDFAIQNGHGKTLNQVMLQAIFQQLAFEKCKKLIHQQLDLFEKYWGQGPDFIDGHQHIHQFNGIRQALIEVIKERYQQANSNSNLRPPYLRVSQTVSVQNNIKSKIIALMGAKALMQIASKENIPYFLYLSGIYNLQIGSITYAERMNKWLEQLPYQNNSILMCHPSTQLDSNDLISEARVHEYQYLKSDSFLQDLNQYNTRITATCQTPFINN